MTIRILIILLLTFTLCVKGQNNKLVPFSKIYKYDIPENYIDSLIQIKYLVNTYKTDKTGYIDIKKGKLHRQLIIKEFINLSLCARPTVSFYSDNLVAFLSDCMNSKSLQLIDLKCKKCDKNVDPYFISTEDSILIYQKDNKTKTFHVSGFDMQTIKTVDLTEMLDCGNFHTCFEEISYENGKIIFKYITKVEGQKKTCEIKIR